MTWCTPPRAPCSAACCWSPSPSPPPSLPRALTRVVTPEQIRRLAEDKAFDYAEATRDFDFPPRSFAEGVRLEARSLGL